MGEGSRGKPSGGFLAWTTSILEANCMHTAPPGDPDGLTRSWRPGHAKSLHSRVCGWSRQTGTCSSLAAPAKWGSSLGAEMRYMSDKARDGVSFNCQHSHLLPRIAAPPSSAPIPSIFLLHAVLHTDQHSSSGTAPVQSLQWLPSASECRPGPVACLPKPSTALLTFPTSCCNTSPCSPPPGPGSPASLTAGFVLVPASKTSPFPSHLYIRCLVLLSPPPNEEYCPTLEPWEV